MKFRRRAPGLLILSTLVVLFSITGIANMLTGRMLESAKAASFDLMRDVLGSNIKSTEDKALASAEVVASMQTVRTAFIAKDRAKLLAETEKMFKLQDEKYGIDQAMFATPPGVAFLRLHDPGRFGEDLTSQRAMLADVHANKVLRKGVVITKAGPAISAIVPMFDDAGGFVGSFEMGLEFEPMLDRIKQAYEIEAAAFLDEKLLREHVGDGAEAAVITPKNRVGRFIRYHSTHPDLAASLVLDKDIEVTEPVSYERVVAGTTWGVQLVPMYNYSSKQIGVYALAKNLGESRSEANRARVWMALAALFGSVFMAGVILVVVRGLLVSPLASLSARMSALLGGDTSQPADPMDTYCEELQDLAKNYEQLRAEKSEKS